MARGCSQCERAHGRLTQEEEEARILEEKKEAEQEEYDSCESALCLYACGVMPARC